MTVSLLCLAVLIGILFECLSFDDVLKLFKKKLIKVVPMIKS